MDQLAAAEWDILATLHGGGMSLWVAVSRLPAALRIPMANWAQSVSVLPNLEEISPGPEPLGMGAVCLGLAMLKTQINYRDPIVPAWMASKALFHGGAILLKVSAPQFLAT